MRNIRNKIASDIPFQFPDVFREEGDLFVEFTKQYYEFLDTRIHRDNFTIRDIDTTYDNFLKYFKNKYLNGLPFEGVVDTRFIIKHINDIYTTKGTEESIRIFFRMFFEEEIDIFYPSTSLLKPSDSVFTFNRYIEMESVTSVEDYPFKRGDKIIGDTSKANAFINQITFKNFFGSITPVLFLSDLVGEFNIDDRLGTVNVETGAISFKQPKIAGSLISLDVLKSEARATGNTESEIIRARSEKGRYGRVSIKEVSERSVGELNLKVNKPGYGYTVPLHQGRLTLDQNASEFDPTIFVTTFPGQDAPTDTQSIRIEGGRRYYGITSVTTTGQTLHQITLSEPLEKAFNLGTKIDLYRKNTITDIYISNQVIPVKPETVSGLTIEQIKEEFDAVANGSGTLHDAELHTFIQAIDENGFQNGDLNIDGIITASDSKIFYNAAKFTDTDAQKKIVEKFSKFIFGEFTENEVIVEPNSGSNGFVIKYEPPLLFLRCSPAEKFEVPSIINFPGTPSDGDTYSQDGLTWTYSGDVWLFTDVTLQRTVGGSPVTFKGKNFGTFNDSASFAVDELHDPETVNLITDVISDFLSVRLDDTNYNMSGSPTNVAVVDIDTTFEDAFIEEQFTLGGVGGFFIYDNGFDYINEAYAVAEQTTFSKFKKHDYIINFEGQPPLLIPGDIASQQITLFNGNSYTAKAEFLRRDANDNFFFGHRTFYELDDDLPITIREIDYTIAGIRKDTESAEIGTDAILEAEATFGIGQIESVTVTNAGYNYTDGEIVDLVADRAKRDELGELELDDFGEVQFVPTVVAKGVATVAGTGFTDGVSQTTTSFLNEPGRVIHDNYYYQEYSYEISSQISPNDYTEVVEDMLSVAGTKLFNSPLINTRSELVPNINIEIDTELFDVQDFSTEDGEILTTENLENLIAVETVGLETIEI